MRGFGLLASLLTAAPAPVLRAANDDEMISILDIVTHMPEETLRKIAGGSLSVLAEDAAREGVAIAMIGAATRDVEIDGDRFGVRCQLRFGRQPVLHDMLVTGRISPKGIANVDEASLLETRSLARTA